MKFSQNRKKFFQKVFFEGDIVLSKEQAEDIFSEDISDDATRKKRKVINSSAYRWSPTRMPIIYMFDGTHPETERATIRSAFRRWESQTCISFKESTVVPTDTKYTRVIRGSGCYSSVGYQGTNKLFHQDLSIGNGCSTLGITAHEIGHALGLWHEQSRSDRSLIFTYLKYQS